jgi:hypothetical protein
MQRLPHIAFVFAIALTVVFGSLWLIQQAAATGASPAGDEPPRPGLVPPAEGAYIPSTATSGAAVAADRPQVQQAPLDLSVGQATTDYTALCRLGVDVVSRPITDYPLEDLAKLRAGWYFNWTTQASPPDVNGMHYAQAVWVKQWKWDNGPVLWSLDAPYAQPYTYTIRPSIEGIKAIAVANPGSLWLIGNEIERRDWGPYPQTGQNEILPEVYAWVYHEVYQAIKEVDPTARVANGSVVAPTPLRLEYLDRVWEEYKRRFGETMPVDVWHIHTHLGPEKRDDWGIGIPAGLDADQGMFYFENERDRILINKDYATAVSLIRDFRVWMKAHGQQNKPLVLSEFGVTMPDWVDASFTPEAIRDEFMQPGINYLLNTKDPEVGYPADEYRLVQTTWWWSLDGDVGKYVDGTFYEDFNGNLYWSGLAGESHSPNSMGFTTLGYYWLGYTSSLLATVNLRPVGVDVLPQESPAASGLVTATLQVKTANSGSVAATQVFSVALYDGGGQLIDVQAVAAGLEGCGAQAAVKLTWPNVLPGLRAARVVVDVTDQIGEISESDNELILTVLIPKHRLDLPIVRR